MRKRLLERAVADIARRQHGVISRSQLAEVGLGRGAIELRLARGRLHVVHARIYSVGHEVLTDHGRWMAATLAGGEGAVLSHDPAAALWGIRPWRSCGLEVITPRRRRSGSGIRFHRIRLPADEVTVHDGIPVTTVGRTLFDLAAVVTSGQLAKAVKEAEVRRLWDSLSLADLLERHPRRPGAAALRAVIDDQASLTRSDLEERFLAFLDRVGLPRPATNVTMWIAGSWIEADCMWREQRLIVELDGAETHLTRAAFESDRARDRALVAAGWRVMRVTWRQLRDDPATLAADLHAALAPGPVANLRRA